MKSVVGHQFSVGHPSTSNTDADRVCTRKKKKDLQVSVDIFFRKEPYNESINAVPGYTSAIYFLSPERQEISILWLLYQPWMTSWLFHIFRWRWCSLWGPPSEVRNGQYRSALEMCIATSQWTRQSGSTYIMVNNQIYQLMCLLFTLATSPREFTKLHSLVVHLLHLRGIQLYLYLDDWLMPADSPFPAEFTCAASDQSAVSFRLSDQLREVRADTHTRAGSS